LPKGRQGPAYHQAASGRIGGLAKLCDNIGCPSAQDGSFAIVADNMRAYLHGIDKTCRRRVRRADG
jgi:hypothetical protein